MGNKLINQMFKTDKAIIGMIHVQALPGTPSYGGNVETIIEKAVEEAKLYIQCGVDGIAIENMHDIPYLRNNVGHEISTLMAITGYEIKKLSDLPCGIQILAGANIEAIAAANSAGLDFVRGEGFVFAHVADEGIIESNAGEILRYRRAIEATNIKVFTDIKKKHSSHAITNDVSITDTAHAAEFFLSDGLIVTGAATGTTASLEEISQVKNTVELPVFVGSGIDINNIEEYIKIADGFIVGSYFKDDGFWKNNINKKRVSEFMDKVRKLR